MVHDGDAAIDTHHGEIAIGTQEEAFSTIFILGGLVDDTLLLGIVQGFQEFVDGADGLIIPESGRRVVVTGRGTGAVGE